MTLTKDAVALRAKTPRPRCPLSVTDTCTGQPSTDFECPLDGSTAAMLVNGKHSSVKEVPLNGGGATGTARIYLDFDASKITPGP